VDLPVSRAVSDSADIDVQGDVPGAGAVLGQVMALPVRSDDYTYRLLRPAELVEQIEKLLKLAEVDAPRRELMSTFSAIKVAFGATIETSGMARRRDIADLLEVHGRILRRAEIRPDRRVGGRAGGG
jgi:hypothetical protein